MECYSVDRNPGPDSCVGAGVAAMSLSSRSSHPNPPPPLHIPPHPSRQSSRRRPIDPSMHLKLRDDNNDDDDADHLHVSPASPGVISSLITSLSSISNPASKRFDQPNFSIARSSSTSPVDGFGVEYGTNTNSRGQTQEDELDLNELAACSPVIRTSKPPSGFSAITAPLKSPRRDPTASFISLLRPSRPTSKSSTTSFQDDETQTIGNLSIERGSTSTPELRKPASQEGWSLKIPGRGHKGLMYMSSKERLRVNENEKRRGFLSPSSSHPNLPSPRYEHILAETSITEEPPHMESPHHNRSRSVDAVPPSKSVPLLGSFSREAEQKSSRPFRKASRSKNKGTSTEAIPEDQGPPSQQPSDADPKKPWDDILMRDIIDLSRNEVAPSKASRDSSFAYETPNGEPLEAPGAGDGAPSPAVYQNNRQSLQSVDRKKLGRDSPDSNDVRSKPSGSKSKRRSGGSITPEPVARKKDPTASDPVVSYERRGSADSIDDAVEAYLCAPRLSQKIQHPQTGRVITFSEVGDPEGSAVFCCVGMGLTRYITAFYDELALALKLRLITPDRPGVGDSEPYDETTTPLSWPDDVYAICQTLKITKFSLIAHSAGAIYALATALRMPQHIRGQIHLLAPWIPPSQMNVFGTSQAMPPANAIPTSQRILRALPTTFLKAANSSFMTATSSSISSSLPRSPRRNKRKTNGNQSRDAGRDIVSGLDKENIVAGTGAKNSSLEDGAASEYGGNERSSQDGILAADSLADKERQTTYDLRLTHAIWDLATTGANPAVDLLVCLERRHTIGFRYVDITRPVIIHHGSRDTRVPVDNVRWLGKAMRRCEVRVLEGEGHGLMASASVMGTVLMEISQEWDDWAKSASPKRNDERRGSRVALR